MTDTLWSPTADRIDRSALREYLNWLEVREGRPFPDHDALWAWSVEDLDRFWSSIADYYKVEFSTPWTTVRTADPMPHARWFSGARLNWAQHALRQGRRRHGAGVRPGGRRTGARDHPRGPSPIGGGGGGLAAPGRRAPG